MRFVCTEEVEKRLRSGKRPCIVIEVARSDHSDFDVTELFLRTCTTEHAQYLTGKKRYRMYPLEAESAVSAADGRAEGAPLLQVLLPPYYLEYDPVVRFYLKKTWLFRQLRVEGVRL